MILGTFSKLVKAIEKSNLNTNVYSLIVFGSQLYENSNVTNDEDFCIVLNTRKTSDLRLITGIFKKYYSNLDITVYYKNELRGSLPFRDIGTGCFALHYFALGKPLIGKNIFIEKYQKLPQKLYKQSLREKMFDYLLRLRKQYIVQQSKEEQVAYFRKYVARLLIDLMIYNDPNILKSVVKDSPEEVFQKAKELKIISSIPLQGGPKAMSKYLFILDEITDKILALD